VQIVLDPLDPSLGELCGSLLIDALKVFGLSSIILAADVQRQEPSLSALVDQPLRRVEIAFGQSVFFKNVAPAA
jgi:hypothetical protein